MQRFHRLTMEYRAVPLLMPVHVPAAQRESRRWFALHEVADMYQTARRFGECSWPCLLGLAQLAPLLQALKVAAQRAP